MASSTDNAASGVPDGPGAARPSSATDRPRAVRTVRYGAMGWVGEFSHKASLVIPCGNRVVLQSDRGIEIGEPLGACLDGYELTIPHEALKAYVRNSGPEFCRQRAGRIMRIATEQDLTTRSTLTHIFKKTSGSAQSRLARSGWT